MKASLFYLPSPGCRAEIEARLAGMRPELYQRMLREISARKRLADGCRLRQVSFTEHFPIADPSKAPTLGAPHAIRLSSCRSPAPQVALRQPVKPPNLFASFCYQLPVNQFAGRVSQHIASKGD